MTKACLIHAPRDQERLPLLHGTINEYRRLSSSFVLVLAPTEERVRQLHASLPSHSRCRIVTFQRFLREQQERIQGDRVILSPEEQLVLLRQILQEQSPGFLARLPHSWRLTSTVARILTLVRRTTDDLDERKTLLRQLTHEMPEAATALAQVDAAYYHYLWNYSLVDEDVLRRELIQKWQTEDRIGRYSALVVDGFSFFFTPVQRGVFAAMFPLFEFVAVTLSTPRGGLSALDTHRGYEYVRDTYLWLQELNLAWEEQVPASQGESSLAEIQERLFAEASNQLPLPTEQDKSFRLIAAPNQREEVRLLARLIRLRLAEGASPDQQNVVVPDDEAYSLLLREIFSEYHLSGPVPYRVRLIRIPIITLIRKWLDGSLNEWNPEALYAALASPHVDFPTECIERLDRWRRAASIHQTFDVRKWQELLERMLVRKHLSRDPDREVFEDNQAHYEAERERMLSDLGQVQQYLQHGKTLRDARSPSEFISALRTLLRSTGIDRRMQGEGETPEQRHNRTAYQLFTDLLDQMARFYGVFQPTDNTAHACREYLYHALENTYCTLASHKEGHIRVMSPSEAASVQHGSLYLLGCVEGSFPSRPQASFLMSPDAPERVPLAGLNRLPEERFLFQQMIGNSEQVVLLYPHLVDGKEQVPSPFVEELRVLFDFGDAPPDQDIAGSTAGENSPLLSVPEVLQAMGRTGVSKRWKTLQLANSNVDTQLYVEDERSQRTRFSIYDGWLDAETSRLVWEEFRGGYYSPTLIERAAACPIRFFLLSVLSLEEGEVLDDEIAPNVRGLLVHRILQRFYEENDDFCDHAPEQWENARRKLKQIAEEEMRPYDEEFPNLYWREDRRALMKGMDQDEPPGILRSWLDKEWDTKEQRFTEALRPAHFEYRFGRSFQQPGTGDVLRFQRYLGPDIRIRGKVDRVDRGDGVFAVYDYKTGAAGSVAQVERGLTFQLAIYLLALQANGMGIPVAGAYYLLSRADQVRKSGYIGDEDYWDQKGRKPHKLYPSDTFERLLNWTEENIRAIDRFIEQGRFHPSIWDENDAGCRYCPYSHVCRYQANRQLNMHLPPDSLYAPTLFGDES